jgi:hypothetical protein
MARNMQYQEEEQGCVGIQYLIWNIADVFHIIAAAVPVPLSVCAILCQFCTNYSSTFI